MDNVVPVVSAASHFETAPVSGTSISLDAAFTETNPNTNTYYYSLNADGYDGGTAGTSDSQDPDVLAITVAAINGDDYFTAIKTTHTDDYGNVTTSEVTTDVYVKPYTPQAPTVNTPTASTVNVAVNAHASAASGLDYAIYITPAVSGNNWIATDGSVGAAEVWQTVATWGTKTITGLSSPVSQYSIQVKSRNSVDDATESDLSTAGQITNTAPVGGYTADNVIPAAQVTQSTDGNGTLTISFKVKDTESDNISLNTFQYSVDGGASWNAPTNSDVSEALSTNWESNSYTSAASFGAASEFNFTFNTKHADLSGLNGVDQSDVQVRFTVNDATTNSASPATSENISVDDLDPVTSAATHFETAPVSGTEITLDAAFTEANPNTNTYYFNLNASGYDAGNAGATNTADPDALAITTTAINGDDYFSAIKTVHVDDNGNTITSEVVSNTYVKPYTPQAPTIGTPTASTVNVAVNAHASAASGLDYAIYITPAVSGNNWIAADGSVGGSEVWQTVAAWGTKTITGLSSPVSQYSIQVKSRNSGDDATESDLSTAGQITNTTPVAGYSADNVIPAGQVSISTSADGIATITFRAKDTESDLVTLESFAFSDDGGSNWYTPANGDNSGALASGWADNSGSGFSSATDWSGTAHSFTFDTKHADVVSSHTLSTTDISNFQIRFKVHDGIIASALAATEDVELDNVAPVTSAATHFENAPVSGTSITLDAAFTETNPNTNTYFYQLNAGAYDAGTSGTTDAADPAAQAITVAAINGDDYFSAIKTTHVDDYSYTITSEVVSNTYVKPYQPNEVTLANPTASSLDATVNAHASAASGLSYAIYVSPAVSGNNWVQADGSVGASEVWQTIATWGTATITGLSSPVSQYYVSAKSRNSVDNTTESDLSNAISISNTSPVAGYTENNVIPAAQVVQSSNADGLITVTFRVKDGENDLVSLESFAYSDDGGSNWYTPANGDNSGALAGGWADNSGNKFSSATDWSGTVHSFTFDSKHADVITSHTLSSSDISNFQLRFKVNDAVITSSLATSESANLDNVTPVASASTHFETAPVAGIEITLDAAFTETNPGTNTYFYNLNAGGYDGGTSGTGNSSDPAALAITTAALNGDDYFSAIKTVHTDDYGNTLTSEVTSNTYVKPYTPQAATVGTPTASTINVSVNAHASGASGLDYAIYITPAVSGNNWVQADGSVGGSEVWQTIATWGTATVTGLSSPVSQYSIQVKSRNSVDDATESDLSTAASIPNTAPVLGYTADNVIPGAQVSQSTDGNGTMTITFKAKDTESDLVTLETFEFSDDGGSNWYSPTNGDNSGALAGGWADNSGSKFTSAADWSGTAHSFTFDTKHADVVSSHSLSSSDISNFLIRFKINDATVSSGTGTSEDAGLDNIALTVATAVHYENTAAYGTTITLDAAFSGNNPGTNVFYYNLNNGGYDAGTSGTSNAVDPDPQSITTGAINGDDYISAIKVVHTDAFGNTTTSEVTSDVYIKPYSPEELTITNPTVSTIDIAVNPHASASSAVDYAIYLTPAVGGNNWVQTDGSVGASEAWQTQAEWGTKTVTGLSSPVAQYYFKSKTRNSRDNVTESDFSNSRSIDNTTPIAGYSERNVIPTAQVIQSTDGNGTITITFRSKDTESDLVHLESFAYSDDGGSNWYTPTNDDNSEALGGNWPDNSTSRFSSATDWTGTAHTFTFNTQHADVVSSHSLSSTDVTNFQVRFKVDDNLVTSDLATSENAALDNLAPVASTAIHYETDPVTGTEITLDAGFTESNPGTNVYYYDLNGAGYDAGTSGTSDAQDPDPLAITVAALNGDDYFNAIKAVHTDDNGNTTTSELTTDYFIKPYTPEAPTISNPAASTMDVVVNANASAASGISYAIYITPAVGGNNWVQADGSVGASEVWQTIATWGTKTITGLSSPVSGYSVQAKSRNSRDNATESDLSTAGAIANTAPVLGYAADNAIPAAQVIQSTDGNGTFTITFRAKDAESDLVSLESFAYSDDGGTNWYTPANGDNSEALASGWADNSGSKFSSATDWSGTAHSFTFNTKHADVISSHTLSAADISNFKVRFKVNDATVASELGVSDGVVLDNAPAVELAVSHFESSPVSGTEITLDAAFTETNPGTNSYYYDLNAGGYDAGTAGTANSADPDAQVITVAEVNGDDYFTAIKSVHTDDYGNVTTSESTTDIYVKPYTPQAPTIGNPTASTTDFTINTHANAASGLSYAIYVSPAVSGNNWVQADGSVGASEVWQTIATWGTETITGLSSPVSQYSIQVKSRNSRDNATESDLSTAGAVPNTTPVAGYSADNVIPTAQVVQSTDGNGTMTITFRAKDAESDLVSLESFEYSNDGGSNWYSPANGDNSGALAGGWADNSGSNFTSAADWSGTAHSFTFNTKHADVVSSQDLSTSGITNFQVRFKINDATVASALATSQDAVLDNVVPAEAIATHFETAPIAGTEITLDVAFTESYPGTNTYYFDLNATGYDGGTAGTSNTADPDAQAITTTINGDDYFTAIKAVHTDDYGNSTTSEVTTDVYVKPYTPQTPTVSTPTVSTVNVVVNAHASGASGIDYAIYITPAVGGNNWVQSDGSVGASEVWQTIAGWGTETITGLSSPVSQYSIQVKSRNSVDDATESDLSTAAAITNTAPVAGYSADNIIPAAQVVQSTDGNGTITVTFRAKDTESDLVTLESFAFSDDGGSNWYSPANGDNSAALADGWADNSGSKFSSASDWSGTAHSFTFNTKHADVVSNHSLSSKDISNLQIRFKVNDATVSSGLATSEDVVLDNVSPVEAIATHFESALIAGSEITLDAAFTETNAGSNTYYYNLNASGYDGGTSGTDNTGDPDPQAITVSVNGDDYFSAIKTVHTDNYGNAFTSELIANNYVKPYTPQTPTINTPTASTVNVTVNAHASAASGLDYAIYITPAVGGNNWVAADGSIGAGEVWQTIATWGTKTITGLSSPVSGYSIQVKSRNSRDNATESDLSTEGLITNTAPVGGYSADDVIPAARVSQSTDGNGIITVSFRAKDDQSDLVTLEVFEFSDDGGSNWYSPANGDNSGALAGGWADNSGSKFSSASDWSGEVHSFTFNTKHADVVNSHSLSAAQISNFRIRFKVNDASALSGYATSQDAVLDNVAPTISSTGPADDTLINNSQVSYTLSEAVASGTVTWTRTGGAVDNGSPHAQSFTGTELNAGAHTDITLTNAPTLADSGVYTIAFDATDLYGNMATQVTMTNVAYDLATEIPVLTAPASNGNDNKTLDIDFSLTEKASSGSVKMTFTRTSGSDDNNSPHIIIFNDNFITEGQHTATLDGIDLSNNANVTSVSSGGNDFLVDDALYSVTLEYQDSLGNTAASVTNTVFHFDNTALSISSLAPVSSTEVNTTQVSYTLSETALSGTVTWTRTGGSTDNNSPHVQSLSGSELDSGAHGNITLTNAPVLVDSTVYTISFNAIDSADNAAAEQTVIGILYDVSTETPILTSPANSSTDNNTLAIDYTLPEQGLAGSVKLTFTQTGGLADGNSPHVVTLGSNGESATQHQMTLNGADLSDNSDVSSVSTDGNDALVDSAIYSVKIEYQDSLGNPVASATNTSLLFDSRVPVFTSTAPDSNTYQNTTQISYTLSEDLSVGSVTWIRTGGAADGSSPHVQSLTGTELDSGVHTDITLSNPPTLVSGAIYSISYNGVDIAGNAAVQVTRSNITCDNTSPALLSATKENDTQIKLNFNETIRTNGGNPTDINVKDSHNNQYTVQAQVDGTVGDSSILLMVSSLAGLRDTLTITYTNSNNELYDLAGNAMTTDNTGVQIIIITNTAPVLGFTADNIIPAAQILQSTDGSGMLTILFRVKDDDEDSVSLSNFQFSKDGGVNWHSPLNTDDSGALSGNWPNNQGLKFAGATDLTGTIHSFTFFTKHADVTAVEELDSLDIENLKIRFKATDGIEQSAYATSQNATLDNVSPAVTISYPPPDTDVFTSALTYSLSENAVSGTVSWTRTGGSEDSNHVQSLTEVELDSGSHTQVMLQNYPALVNNGIYTISLTVTDSLGNQSTAYRVENVTKILPSDSIPPEVLNVSTSADEDWYKIGDTIPITIQFSDSVKLEGGNLLITLETGNDKILSVPAFDYTDNITVDYIIQSSDTASDLRIISPLGLTQGSTLRNRHEINTLLTIPSGKNLSDVAELKIDGIIPTISGLLPGSDTTINSPVISYNLSETFSAGTVTWLATGGTPDSLSPQIINLTGTELSSGSHTNVLLSGSPQLQSEAIYTITFAGSDSSGNQAQPVSVSEVYFDTTSRTPVITKPTAEYADTVTIDSAITEIVFNLPETALENSVKLSITPTGGRADSSIHILHLSVSDSGQHSVLVNIYDLAASSGLDSLESTGNSLVSDAVYQLKLEYSDVNGSNAAYTEVSGYTPVVLSVPDRVGIVKDTSKLVIDSAYQFSAVVYDSLNHPLNGQLLSWEIISDIEGIGVLDSNKIFSPGKMGSGEVVARLNSTISDTLRFTVPLGAVTSVAIINDTIRSFSADTQYQYQAFALDERGNADTSVNINWSITSDIGTVDSTGIFNPVKVGMGYIVATFNSFADTTDTISVLPGSLISIVATPDSAVITTDSVLQFSIKGFDQYDNLITTHSPFQISNSCIGTIDSVYRFTPVAIGQCTLIVSDSISGIMDTIVIAVTPGIMKTLTVIPDTSLTIAVGDTFRFTALALDKFDNPTYPGILTWDVNDPATASIDSTGLLTAIAESSKLKVILQSTINKTTTLSDTIKVIGHKIGVGGGIVTGPDNIKLNVPSEVFNSDVVIQIEVVPNIIPPSECVMVSETGYRLFIDSLNQAVELNSNLAMTIPEDRIPTGEYMDMVRVFTLDENGNWRALPNVSIDSARGIVSSDITTLGTYMLGVDMQKPTINLDQISDIIKKPENAAIPLKGKLFDNTSILESYLIYRAGGENEYDSIRVEIDPTDSSFAVDIPDSIASATGVEFSMVSYDGTQFSNTILKALQIFIALRNHNKPFPKGSWKVFSIPLLPENNSVENLLDMMGKYNDKKWRLFDFRDGAFLEYNKDAAFTTLEPGRGYWMYVKSDEIFLKTISALTPKTTEPYEVFLNPGWNLISSPYYMDVSWESVQSLLKAKGNDTNVAGPYFWDADSLRWDNPFADILNEDVLQLKKWEGYAVKNLTDKTITLEIPAVKYEPKISMPTLSMNNRLLKKTAGNETRWHCKITVSQGKYKDVDNYIGIQPTALNKWDKYDYPEPGGMGEYIALYFTHRSRDYRPGVYTTDFRAPFEDGQSWPMEILSSVDSVKDVSLNIENLHNIPEKWEVYLYDNDTRYAKNLRDKQNVAMTLPKTGTKKLKMLIGTMDYIMSKTGGRIEMPQVFKLNGNFPNPFRAYTTFRYQLPVKGKLSIAVYNIRGEKLFTLGNETLDPGYYQTIWDPENEANRQITTGTYVYSFVVRDPDSGSILFRRTRKIVRVR
ncbi:MAG: hypothetical protein HQK83_09570 [Fibrobacteria bacterium]|nr:hypothetical protein [Fibrobacteria bacterium]